LSIIDDDDDDLDDVSYSVAPLVQLSNNLLNAGIERVELDLSGAVEQHVSI
jgi:hypothetical protein